MGTVVLGPEAIPSAPWIRTRFDHADLRKTALVRTAATRLAPNHPLLLLLSPSPPPFPSLPSKGAYLFLHSRESCRAASEGSVYYISIKGNRGGGGRSTTVFISSQSELDSDAGESHGSILRALSPGAPTSISSSLTIQPQPFARRPSPLIPISSFSTASPSQHFG